MYIAIPEYYVECLRFDLGWHISGGKPSEIFSIVGKTKVAIIHKEEAPPEESKLEVMLELTGGGFGEDRAGVDLVTVLDVSERMGEEKLVKMKKAVQFLIKKLSPTDRLSVVTFSDESTRLCPLRQITENSQAEIESQVNDLAAGGGTANATAGLETGLRVLSDRSLTSGRVAAIMIVSGGEQSAAGDTAQVPVGSVPIYTFGFGTGQGPQLLKAIADNSMGGTFSDVENTDTLSTAFSQCLAGLLTVAVQDLKLTFAPPEDSMVIIESVSAGDYPQSRDNADGSVTVSFGDLYDKEQCRVMVDLLLPAVTSQEIGVDVLQVDYTYSTKGRLFDGPSLFAAINRTGIPMEQEAEVMVEENLQHTVRMKSQEIDEMQGRAFALSSETSHDRQRFAARSGHPEKLRLFATPRMDAYLEQAKLFDNDPSEPLPTADEDVKKDIGEMQGRAFALSYETSHDRQRFATRGDIEKLRLFATPRMDTYLEQAKLFDNDPREQLPTADEDVKKDIGEMQGRAFALSSETSRDRQRFATRGDMEKLRLFATPRMGAYFEQAKLFDNDPNEQLPTADKDVKKDIDEMQGHAFALSSETSHDRQRFDPRGDAEKLHLIATPRTDAYLEQAKLSGKDPSEPLPTVDEVVKKDINKMQGRAFALSSETSHARQRFAARGHPEKLRLFATPRMDAYLEQAKSFNEDPSKLLPTGDEGVKEENAVESPRSNGWSS